MCYVFGWIGWGWVDWRDAANLATTPTIAVIFWYEFQAPQDYSSELGVIRRDILVLHHGTTDSPNPELNTQS